MLKSKGMNTFATVFLLILTVLTMLPILLIVISSFTAENALIRYGYSFFPKQLSTDAYYYMVKQGATIFRAYGISIFVTAFGTVCSVIITTMLAYPMSRKAFRYKNALAFFVFFTMLFNGGIVPTYIMWTRIFGIKNTIWALIIPNYLVNAFNVILVKNYYQNNVPDALVEAAQIDGASELTIFFKVMLPLAIPTVATISLFTGLAYWNDWTNGLYYISDQIFIQLFFPHIQGPAGGQFPRIPELCARLSRGGHGPRRRNHPDGMCVFKRLYQCQVVHHILQKSVWKDAERLPGIVRGQVNPSRFRPRRPR